MLSLGGSKPWPEAMEAITGQRKMDASALLEYFSTLQAWLEAENERTGEYIGWEHTTKGKLNSILSNLFFVNILLFSECLSNQK